MSAFSNIPPQAVLPLGAYDKTVLERAARRADQVVLASNCSTASDKASVLRQIGSDLELPEHFGQNLDALYDCLTDLETDRDADQPGLVVFLENLPAPPDFSKADCSSLLDVFRDAADYFYDQSTAFRVFYSIRK